MYKCEKCSAEGQESYKVKRCQQCGKEVCLDCIGYNQYGNVICYDCLPQYMKDWVDEDRI